MYHYSQDSIQIRTNYLNFSEQGLNMSGTPSKIPKDDQKPPSYLIHSALCTAQVIFGISAVVGSIGLPSFHPLTFALVREACASLVLLAAAHFASLKAGRKGGIISGSIEDFPKFVICGIGLFGSQAFFIIGIKLSSAVAASVWQPTQPIFTAAVCMLLGWEPFSFTRCVGILVAFFGCAIMVLGGGGSAGEAIGGEGGDNGAFAQTVGQFSFFLNCCGSALYVLSSKTIIKTERYESVAVTAWSYTVASVLMLIFAVLMSMSEGISTFLCSDCVGSIWHVPPSAIPAMAFFIIMTSSLSYGLITWANKYASGTMVIGYTVTQPVASAIVIQTLVSFGFYEGCKSAARRFLEDDIAKACLDLPDMYTAIGAVGVFFGLVAIIHTEPKKEDMDITGPDNEYPSFDEAEGLLELAERSGFSEDPDNF
mmetsp:Transcript_14307/g.21487  ORF Transcript_14307/g.21487 Transcript_14307/m.21487 type:complete len:425 (-) Transcript_14307:1044-2318(-)